MSADDGDRRSTGQAAQACVMCKIRKKKCNKALPSCGYCTWKQLDCVYAWVPGSRASPLVENTRTAPARRARPPSNATSSRNILSTKIFPEQSTAETKQNQVYLEVQGVIRATGRFADDISASYFQGFHRHLPIICRTRFYSNLVTSGVTEAADFSVLLLALCLITNSPALEGDPLRSATESVDQRSLYLTAKSLLVQVQTSYQRSIPLIQATLLLAVYEYKHGRPEDAFVTISISARMAYAARIHTRDYPRAQMAHTANHKVDADLILQSEEAANTWWGIIVCERIFFSEMSVLDQPLITVFPGGAARLPTEPHVLDQLDNMEPESLPNISVTSLTLSDIGGFGRTVQATCLLDQVIQGVGIADIDSKLLQLDRLSTNIQAFAALVMPHCQDHPGAFCVALHISIRALYTLHWHILEQQSHNVKALFLSLEEWHKRSQEALDTVTKMIVDMAGFTLSASPASTVIPVMDTMPPTYPYIALAALRHLHSLAPREGNEWSRSAENMVQLSFDKYLQRWNLADEWTRSR